MSLIYFDGMDQYVPVAAPSAGTPCTAAVLPSANLTTVPTDPSPFSVDAAATMFCRNFNDDRVWRVPRPVSINAAAGTYAYGLSAYGNTYNSLATGGVTLDLLQTVGATQSFTIGFKMKYASSAAFPMLLGAFAADTFTNFAGSFAIIMTSDNKVYIRKPEVASFGGGIYASGIFPTNTFVDTTDGFIGVSNFVVGTATATATNPTIDKLSSNTVEIQYTALGKISVWINNQFVGTATFSTPATYTNVRYAKINCLTQANFGNGSTQYFFAGIADLYMLNGLGTKNTSRLGKVKVVSRLPQTDSSVTFTRPDTSNTNASVVSQSPVQVSPALIGTKTGDVDLYGSSAFNFGNEAIIATAITTVGYKTDPSGNDIAPVLNVSGTNYVGTNNTLPVSTTLMKSDQYIYETNPNTGLPFTKSELDATTFGVTVVAPSAS